MIPFGKRRVTIIVLLLIGIVSSTYMLKYNDSLLTLKYIHRSLRGGSYSGSRSSGGGSWGGGSSSRNSNWGGSNYNRNRNYNNYRRSGGMSTIGKVFAGLAFAGIGLALMAVFFPAMGAVCCGPLATAFCCGAGVAAAGGAAAATNNNNNQGNYYNAYHNNQEPGLQRKDVDFEARVQEVKREVENHSRITQQSQVNEPFSGQYTTSFHDPESGVMHNASVGLFFTPDIRGRGFKISGQGSDIDGMTVIEDGHANYDGTAWWRERNITGDVGLQVLSRGGFNFQQSTFQGIWLANTMLTGPYNSFSAIHNNNHQQQMNYAPPPTTTSISGVGNSIAGQQGGFNNDVPVVQGYAVQGSVVNATNNNIPQPNQNPTIVTVTGQSIS